MTEDSWKREQLKLQRAAAQEEKNRNLDSLAFQALNLEPVNNKRIHEVARKHLVQRLGK